MSLDEFSQIFEKNNFEINEENFSRWNATISVRRNSEATHRLNIDMVTIGAMLEGALWRFFTVFFFSKPQDEVHGERHLRGFIFSRSSTIEFLDRIPTKLPETNTGEVHRTIGWRTQIEPRWKLFFFDFVFCWTKTFFSAATSFGSGFADPTSSASGRTASQRWSEFRLDRPTRKLVRVATVSVERTGSWSTSSRQVARIRHLRTKWKVTR